MDPLPLTIPKALEKAAQIFAQAGGQCWLVGGALRDGFLNRQTDDFDLATNLHPEKVRQIFHRSIPTGIKHGTITILLGSYQFETTTFREDSDYSDGRHPDHVSYADTIEEDLSRRDFSINAMAYDLIKQRMVDPYDGRGDLKRRLIRAIGIPKKRFEEDALRVIRACRFAAQLDFTIDAPTKEAIKSSLKRISSLSVERLWDEWKKILRCPAPSLALHLFQETGLLPLLLPQLDACIGIMPKNWETDIYEHSLLTCDLVPAHNFCLRIAALLHDIGKISRLDGKKEVGRDDPAHAFIAGLRVEEIFKHYKASHADLKHVKKLVQEHSFSYDSHWTDSNLRRFIARVGLKSLDELFALRRADLLARGGKQGIKGVKNLACLSERVQKIVKNKTALSMKDLAINGHELMAELGIVQGPSTGQLLRYLLDSVLEDPQMNTKEKLLDAGKRWLE